MTQAPLMESYTYWIPFVVDIKTIAYQQFCAGAFTLYYPLDCEGNVFLAAAKIEHDRELPTGSVTILFWKRIA